MSEISKALDSIECEIYEVLKPYGFRKHGRTLHRFVENDISQVIFFQVGQAHLASSHIFTVRIGIRIPECKLRSFNPDPEPRKYYREYECNIRSSLGSIKGKSETCYNLRYTPRNWIISDIIQQIETFVIPTFEVLSSRDAIIAKRKNYPHFDCLSNIPLFEEAMIHGRRGDMDKAEQAFNQHLRNLLEQAKNTNTITRKGWILHTLEEANRLGFIIETELQNRINQFLQISD